MRFLSSLLLLLTLTANAFAQQRPMTFADVMQFKAIQDASISADGQWLAFSAVKDRGDQEVVVRSTQNETRYVVPLGDNPVISNDGMWVAMKIVPSLEVKETADKGDIPNDGMALLNTSTGDVEMVENVAGFAFSATGEWLAIHHEEEEDDEDDDEEEEEEDYRDAPSSSRIIMDDDDGTMLELRHLGGDSITMLKDVMTYALDEAGTHIAYTVFDDDNEDGRNGLYVRDLAGDTDTTVDTRENGHYTAMAWSEHDNTLAFVASEKEDDEAGDGTLMQWQGSTQTLVAGDGTPDGWHIPANNDLTWSDDGNHLFFGLRPDSGDDAEGAMDEKGEDDEPFEPYDLEALRDQRGVDVWHWDDPLINSNQKKVWNREQDRLYQAVYHVGSGSMAQLADELVRDVRIPDNAHGTVAGAPGPYSKEITWDGSYRDLYHVRLSDGHKKKVAERLSYQGYQVSPSGRYVVLFMDGHWHIFDSENGVRFNATINLNTTFANEDHDYPSDVPGYGIGGWLEDDGGVLIYDKFDIWHIPFEIEGGATMITGGAGRAESRQFRIIKTDPDQSAFGKRETLLLSSYHDLDKNDGFYQVRLGRDGVTQLLEAPKQFTFRGKAEEADVFLFSREDYNEFPDLWVSETDFSNARRVTDVNPHMSEFAWGTSELVEWNSTDGRMHQGVVMKPGNYDPNKRYPVIVYFYRFMSQRLHQFNQPLVNHRPAFPLYTSNDYVVFLPDVRFEIGRPGLASMKSIIPGVQKLVDLGIADPDAIGLHGHSWSGYQTAFIITQTDIFACAIAGAPVSNMTSAYGGIRWGTGMARQFQYEKTQSRLGGSLWEARDHYIDNSPLFFADKINTPLLFWHGDIDGAVPWYQSIELYLAMRRLGKPGIFLQYRNEDHHLAKYPNKLDYAMKMKEYFDHYLKGTPAAKWITDGVLYSGD